MLFQNKKENKTIVLLSISLKNKFSNLISIIIFFLEKEKSLEYEFFFSNQSDRMNRESDM